MPVTVNYLNGSGSKQYGSRFQEHTCTHNFHISQCAGDTGMTTTAAVLDRFADQQGEDGWRFKVGVPLQYQTGTGDSSSWNNATRPTEYGAWVVREINVVATEQMYGSFRVTVVETNMGRRGYQPLGGGALEYEGDYDFALNFAGTGQLQEAWRSNPEVVEDTSGPPIYSADGTDFQLEFCPEPWQFCNMEEDDIGGVDIAINKAQPLKLMTAQTSIQVEYIIREPIQNFDGSYVTPYTNAAGNDPRLFTPTLEAQIGDRNFDGLGSFARGSLLLTSVSVQPMHMEFKRVILTLLYDEWFHAKQRPAVSSSGVIPAQEICDGDDADVINLRALAVGWVQPYLTGFSWGSTPDTFFNDGFTNHLITALYGDPSKFAASPAGEC